MKRTVVLAGVCLALGAASARAQEAGVRVVKTGAYAEDLYLAGERVEFRGEAQGDLFAAGRAVTVAGLVGSDLFAAGSRVSVAGQVRDDARVVGRSVVIDAAVGDGLLAAGEAVRVTAATEVGGHAWLAGRRIDVEGRIGRELRAAGARVRISGTVQGDVVLAARDIEILPAAQIRGSLTYWSGREARIDPGARIGGRVLHRRPEFLDRAGRVATVLGTITRVVFVVNLLLAGIIVLLLFPGPMLSAAWTIGREPWKSLGLGLAVLVLAPVAAGLSVLTIVGAPLGLALIPFYLAALLLGLLAAAFFLGEVGARALGAGPDLPRGWRVLSLAGALVALSLIRFIPVLGNVVLLLALAVGLGAWTLWLSRRRSGEAPEG